MSGRDLSAELFGSSSAPQTAGRDLSQELFAPEQPTRIPPDVQTQRDQEAVAIIESERQKNLAAGNIELASVNAREIARLQKNQPTAGRDLSAELFAPAKKAPAEERPSLGSPMGEDFGSAIMEAASGSVQPKSLVEKAAQSYDPAAQARGASFPVTQGYVDGLRAEIGKLPLEQRMPALQELAKQTNVNGAAAQALLNQVNEENARRDPIQQMQDETLFRKLKNAPQVAPERRPPGKGKALPERVVIPDITPTPTDLESEATPREIAERRAFSQKLSDADMVRNPERQKQYEEQAISEARKRFAEENPNLGALGAGSAGVISGLANIPSVSADFFNQTFINPILQATGLDPIPRVGTAIGTEYLAQSASDYMPKVGKQEMGEAYDRGEFAPWLLTKLAANSPQMAQSLAAAFIPPLRAILLPSMALSAAGQSYAEGDDSRVAAAKGAVEYVSEKIPLQVFDKVNDVLKGMSPLKQRTILAVAGQRLLQSGGAITVNALTNAIEETAAQFGGNVLDKYFQGKNIDLTKGLAEAAVVGAATGKALSVPQVAGIATGAYEPKNVVAKELADLLSGGEFTKAGITQDVAERLRTEPGVSSLISPEATAITERGAPRAAQEPITSEPGAAPVGAPGSENQTLEGILASLRRLESVAGLAPAKPSTTGETVGTETAQTQQAEAQRQEAAAAPAPNVVASSGTYAVADAITAEGPAPEVVSLVVRPDGTAFIKRGDDVIDVTNMARAGFSSEKIIAQTIGDDTSGSNVARQPQEQKPATPSAISEPPPFVPAEEIAAESAPVSEEVEKLTADQKALAEQLEPLEKRTAGTSLYQVLRNTLNNGELSELAGKAKGVGKNPFTALKAPADRRGSSMEDMADSGRLDLFLPPGMRRSDETFDSGEAAEYLREKLRNGDYFTYETKLAIDLVDAEMQSIERQIQQLLTINDINKELQYAADEQRELNQAAAELAPAEEGRVAEPRAGEEEGFLKPQTEAELAAREQERQAAQKREEETRREEERRAAAPKPEEFVLTGSERAADEAAARGQIEIEEKPPAPKEQGLGEDGQIFEQIEPLETVGQSVAGDESTRSPSLKRKIKTLSRRRDRGEITDQQFIEQVNDAIDADEEARFAGKVPSRTRGADYIRQRLLEAKRRGDLSAEAVDLAEWFIQQNEALVGDLGIAIKTPKQGGTGGFYNTFARIMVLMKQGGSENTIVHEILHHLERMMPAEIRSAIRKEWMASLLKAQKNAKTPQQKLFFAALMNHHLGSGAVSGIEIANADVGGVLKDMMKRGLIDGANASSYKLATDMLRNGDVPIGYYQYASPSEFWAVNGSDIVRGRFNAIKGGLLARLKNWLRELGQKIKGVFGLRSEAPLIKALDSLAKSDGKFVTSEMLEQKGTDFLSVEPRRPSGPAVSQPQTGVKRMRDSWMVARDEVGRLSFGPGAKAYDTVARISNAVLDKVAMKPISNELSRSIRNMKAEVNKVQNQIVGVAKELEKLSPQEREMISDVIEGELKAGVHPPQHILNIAASMREIMNRQSEELVRLGMLSSKAAARWENKYLPRFYMNKLRDDIRAWAKAAQRLMSRQPMMRGIKGDGLKARGIFETIYTDQLQEWLDAGWEQRDPNFDPEKSETTVVWRDYTREERENMGEIRDAMFRFVMGYNSSQRDVALGRLYENLAENYASKSPMEGYVQVPDTKVPGTMASRYGKLAGLYVPREIMDHLAHNDESVAEGVLKLYRAALSKWKEGKTVLNPVSHANNVLSNLTMAHFAGVSYWDGHKYAGAVKDIVTNDEMLQEAKDVGLFLGTFKQSELVESMPPQLRALANMTESQASKLGERLWDTLAFTVSYKGKKYGARPVMQWMYENEDLFFRYLIYRDARKRGMEPEDAREYSQQFIFTYDDLPKGARVVRDFGMPFFAYTYKVVPVIARTAMEYPWRFAAPATVAYAVNAAMYSIAAGMGGGDDDWWAKTLYKYVTDSEFRKKVKEFEEEERKKLPPWMKGRTALGTEKAIRLGMDEVTEAPLFLDMSRIFPGGDLLDAENNAGGVAMLQPLTPSNPLFTTLVAMFPNEDMFFGKKVTKPIDTDAEKAQKRAAWMWKQWAPAISVGNYHFDRAMNVMANVSQKPITVDAGPMGVVSYTGIGKDGLPVQPKYAAMQTMGIKVRPYDLEVSEAIEKSKQDQLIREIELEISRLNRLERKGAISEEAGEIERTKLKEKKQLLREGLTVEGKERK